MFKWIRRIILSLVGAIVLMIVFFIGVIVFDGMTGISATAFTNVTYEAEDGTILHAYLTMPQEDGVYPAVMMVHEWWGLNAEVIELADELAQEGYVVLAPDTYRGPTTAQIPRALYLRLSVDEERVDSDMMVAYEYLTSLPEVDADRVGTVGFCYGGGVVLRHAIQNPEIDITINLYGDTIADPTAFGALLDDDAGRVVGIFGGQDAQIPVEEVEAYEAAMNEAGINNTVTVYSDMGHAFVQPDVIHEPGQAQDAWQQILNEFDATLKPESER